MRFNHIDELLPLNAFRSETGRAGGKLLSLEGKDSPPAPDYKGAAQETAQGNLEAARASAAANRVNQITPYGNLAYTQTPTKTLDAEAYNAALAKYQSDSALYKAGKLEKAPVSPNQASFMKYNPDAGWTATQTLSPEEQQKLGLSNKLSLGLLGTAQTGLGYVDKALSTGGKLDESKLAQMPISGQSVQDAIMSRLTPQLERDREALRTRLVNQGLMEGSQAYNTEQQVQGQKENDLYTQAALQGINSALTSRQQGIQEQYTAQDRPLNIINALRTGNQVQTPAFTSVPQQQTTSGADLLQASQLMGQYNSGETASKNATTTGTAASIAAIAAAYF